MKRPEGGFLGALLVPLIASVEEPVISSVLKGTTAKVVRRAEKRYMNKNF